MRDEVYIQHIIEALELIEEYTGDISREDFLEEKKTQDAVIRQIEVIGEAAKQVSAETRDSRDKVPWQDMAQMRDRLIHGYFSVDAEIVWETTQTDIPELYTMLVEEHDS